VFDGDLADALSRRILDGVCRVGRCRGGLLVFDTFCGPVVSVTAGEVFAEVLGRFVFAELLSTAACRFFVFWMSALAEALGVELSVE
jgi:hypothetical protein